MPIENLIVMTLNDVSQVQIECICGACFTFDPDKEMRLPIHCHQCGARWKDDFTNTLDQQVVEGFMRMIREIRRQQQANPRMKIKLIFREGDSIGSSSPGVP